MKISRWLSVSLIGCFCQDLNKIRAERDETILELNRTAHELAEIELQIEEANRFHWTMHIFIPGLIILFIQGPVHIMDILNFFMTLEKHILKMCFLLHLGVLIFFSLLNNSIVGVLLMFFP